MHFLRNERRNKRISSKNILTKLRVAACLVLFLLPIYSFADNLDQKINNLENLKDQTTQQKNSLQGEVANFDSQISKIQAQINTSQDQIGKINLNIVSTNQQINQAETDLKKQRELMGEYLETMYIEGQVSTVELIVKSNNFSDFINQSEYLGAIQQNVQETANKIVSLRQELDKKKKSLEVDKAKAEQLKATQLVARQALDNQRAAKNTILQQTKGNEASYQKMLTALYAERAARWSYGGSSTGGSGGGYPWANTAVYWDGIWHCVSDSYNMCARQCTSYAAWRAATSGIISASDIRTWGSSGSANGGEWANLARAYGYRVDKSPAPNTIISWPVGTFSTPSYTDYYGHVAYVKSVNSDGTMTINEFNFSQADTFDERYNVPIGNAWIIHPK